MRGKTRVRVGYGLSEGLEDEVGMQKGSVLPLLLHSCGRC